MFYTKTKMGQQVSPVNTCGLSWPERFALMLVNGKRSDEELSSTMNAPFEQTMRVLREGGFVERVSAQAPGDGAMAAPAAERQRAPQTKRSAVRWLSDQLGPHADTLSIRIERAATNDELVDALRLAHAAVVRQLGASKAAGFRKLLPDDAVS